MSETNAINGPVRRPGREQHSADTRIDQKAVITDGRPEGDNIVQADSSLTADMLSELAFMEDPVTIRIEPSSAENAPPAIDCWVNGRGAEALINGRWMQLGWLPVGVVVTTKRKYLEVLAKAKRDRITTNVVKLPDSERNEIQRATTSIAPFSVISDPSPKGADWLTHLLQRNF